MVSSSSSSDRKLTDAMGAKTARACDYCIRKRARWYCAADDAFLCQTCDSFVHSANPLARRHERVQLKTLSLNSTCPNLESLAPSWHRGLIRKARTPRHTKYNKRLTDYMEPVVKNPLHVVPEICSDENSHDENDDQLLYRVPIFDPFLTDAVSNQSKAGAGHKIWDGKCSNNIPSEIELAEFAADVESLLGNGLDDESFDMEGLGFLGGNIEDQKASTIIGDYCSMFSHDNDDDDKVKVEDDDDEVFMANHHNDFDTLDLKFDYDDSPDNVYIEEEKENEEEELSTMDKNKNKNMKTILLNLDYEGVILAWPDQRSPWTTGERPDLNCDDGWPAGCMVARGYGTSHPCGDMGMRTTMSGQMGDGGREARVSRYREKRRTRLFSKKIRYEVRKLNAEKRPRMKGRFVKRANFPPLPLAFPLLNN